MHRSKSSFAKGFLYIYSSNIPKFRRNMPLVNNVKGFEGIRLHPLNKPEDSLGCIGFGKNDKVGWISNSGYWTGLVEEKIKTALGRGEPVKLVID